MQTVPSLIGTGTAVAAAATGLIFGQLAEGQLPPPTPRSDANQNKSPVGFEFDTSVFSSRPGTTDSAAAIADNLSQFTFPQQQSTTNAPRMPRRSSQAQIVPPKSSNWRYSYGRQGDVGASPIAEDSRHSSSSNGSWMRRLSLRPISQHESVRSSLGPDSQSMFSHGSAAPILSPTSITSPQLPPNKLVKRSSTRNGAHPGLVERRSSKSQMPTLRRPATSHQRSATLHQMTVEAVGPIADHSTETRTRPRAKTLAVSNLEPAVERPPSAEFRWKSFIHARIARVAMKSSAKKGDGGAPMGAKRVCVEQKGYERAYLITPRSVMAIPVEDDVYYADMEPDTNADVEESPRDSKQTGSSPNASAGDTPTKPPRRSMSMQFKPPTNWMPKSGSIRRRKRGAPIEPSTTDKRSASDPVPSKSDVSNLHAPSATSPSEGFDQPGMASKVETDLVAIFQPPSGNRSASSPLPPLSRLSSFHVDLSRLGSSDSQSKLDSVNTAGLSSGNLRVNSNISHAQTMDRASTVPSSEYHRGFMSGDDDDTDFKTDTPYDSLRTSGSGRRKTLDSPLESMFDESPPSTGGIARQPKRLSIQEILGPSFDGGSRIMEEDEGSSTPVRRTHDGPEAHFGVGHLEERNDVGYPMAKSNVTLATRDFGRLSLDDDDDLDWTRDDDHEVYNHLSPPGSMNSRRGSPNHRAALTIISGNGARDSYYDDVIVDRPRSNIFDWAEPASHEKLEGDGHYLRPKTVHGKQELDIRGGRAASRRGPIAAHIRSQSVPVVQDLAAPSKPIPKFGTWGLGSKNVSEDWDEDFEFEEETDVGRPEGKKAEHRASMVVPPSIQATQPTVKAHSGQIRELSLLVNDLKRLCRLGREMDMIGGSYLKLWREAEGIIALASPDEDSAEDETSSTSTGDSHSDFTDQRFVDEGFDGGVLEQSAHLSKVNTQIKTAVYKGRTQARRRSVFSPEDDIFGTWANVDGEAPQEVSHTPEPELPVVPYNPASVARSLVESMHLRRRQPTDADYEDGDCTGRLNFDTNSLKELVRRAGDLRDSLSDLVRRADHIASSPIRTPRRDRGKNDDGSPAFTRVFDDPTSTPPRPLPHSRSSNSVLNTGSITNSPSNGLGQRLQMMTVG